MSMERRHYSMLACIVCGIILSSLTPMTGYAKTQSRISHACGILSQGEKIGDFLNYPLNAFWAHKPNAKKAYIYFIRNKEEAQKEYKNSQLRVPITSAIIMSAIVSRDLSLLKQYYSSRAQTYFLRHGRPILVRTMQCGFHEGFIYLLKNGVDPNEYRNANYSFKNTGPFDYALLSKNYTDAMTLLDYGYHVNGNHAACTTMMKIVRKESSKMPRKLHKRLANESCKR